MRRWQWWALGAAAYAGYAIATLPAHLALRWLPVGGAVELTGIGGTVWNGRAIAGSVAGLAVSDFAWQLSPWAVLLGRLRGHADARMRDGFVDAEFSVTPTTMQLRNARASTDLSILAEMPTLALLGALAGQASLTLAALQWQDNWITELAGELRLRGLAVPPLLQPHSTSLIALGNYVVELGQAESNGLVAAFRDEGGPLEVSGSASLDEELEYRLEAKVRARADAAPELVQGLELMAGAPDAQGFRQLRLSGTL